MSLFPPSTNQLYRGSLVRQATTRPNTTRVSSSSRSWPYFWCWPCEGRHNQAKPEWLTGRWASGTELAGWGHQAGRPRSAA